MARAGARFRSSMTFVNSVHNVGDVGEVASIEGGTLDQARVHEVFQLQRPGGRFGCWYQLAVEIQHVNT